MTPPQHQVRNGFTLLEALVCLSITAILLALSFASLHTFTQWTECEVARSTLTSLLEKGMTEARIRQIPIALHYEEKKSATEPPQMHFVLFVNAKKDGVIQPTQILSETILPLKKGRIFSRFFPIYRSYVLFFPQNHQDNGSFWYCQQHKIRWAIILNSSGAFNILYPDPNGNVIDHKAQALVCR